MKKIIIISFFTIGLVGLFISNPLRSNDCKKESIRNINDSITHAVNGIIVSKNKAIIRLKMDKTDSLPQKDQSGVLSKYFENKYGNMNITGWLDIADIKVVSVKGAEIDILVEKELSITYINGEKKNHFQSGNQIKITWKTLK